MHLKLNKNMFLRLHVGLIRELSMKLLYMLASILPFISFSASSAECLKDGQKVSFAGNISRETFPGRPNYNSIDDGDEPETYWILTIESPHCVVAESMEDGALYEVARTTTRFQLAFEDSTVYQTQKSLIENKAIVKGKIFIGMTGHHHTKALISVSSIVPELLGLNN